MVLFVIVSGVILIICRLHFFLCLTYSSAFLSLLTVGVGFEYLELLSISRNIFSHILRLLTDVVVHIALVAIQAYELRLQIEAMLEVGEVERHFAYVKLRSGVLLFILVKLLVVLFCLLGVGA